MTFSAKTSVKRAHRPSYQGDSRRTLWMTIGFGAVVVIALLILAGAVAASWYGDHLSSLAAVNGQQITKDDFRDAAKVATFKLDYQETQIRQAMQDGKVDSASGQAKITAITNKRQSLPTDTMNALIDATLINQLAAQQGVTISDQQVEDQITKDATVPEQRHLWVMGVKPQISTGATAPTDQQKADAKAKADQALADLKSGKAWADVAKNLTDDVYSSTGGDAGWLTKDDTTVDTSMRDALFTLPVNGLTDVIEGSDGVFRIGRVTDIQAASTDAAYQQKIKDAGISLDAYRKSAKADALQTAFEGKLLGDVLNSPTAQRHVAEILLKLDSSSPQGTGDEVQVRHILFAPKGDPQGAATLSPTDPAWAEAEQKADAAYAQLKADPSQFAALATALSDDQGTKSSGGLLPYYAKSNLDLAFGNAVFADGLKKGDILPPVKSAYGWHVIQFEDRRKSAQDRINDIINAAKAPGADFAALAKQYSEDTTSKDNGGDVGWIARNQLDSARELAIFKPAVGGLTDPITAADGIYLYKILDEQNRLPDPTQAATIRANGWNNYFTAQKNFARIERFYDSSGASIPTVQ